MTAHWIIFTRGNREDLVPCDRFKGEYTRDKSSVTIYNSTMKITMDGELGKQFWEKVIRAMPSGSRVIRIDLDTIDNRELQISSQNNNAIYTATSVEGDQKYGE